jgi:ferredoxin
VVKNQNLLFRFLLKYKAKKMYTAQALQEKILFYGLPQPLLYFFKEDFCKRAKKRNKAAGSLEEDLFKQKCIRCGNCIKVCVTNGLQPVLFETGLDGVWTPKLDANTGYCEYECVLCGEKFVLRRQ